MQVLEKKSLEEIAQELADESPLIGGDFGSLVTEKLGKYGYDPYDLEMRNDLITHYYNSRRSV